jgi:hypothetical protein
MLTYRLQLNILSLKRRYNQQTGRHHEGGVGEGSLRDTLSLPGSYNPLFPIASCCLLIRVTGYCEKIVVII